MFVNNARQSSKHFPASMIKLLLILAFICAVAYTSFGQSSETNHLPGPPYPADALKAKVAGSGTCQVVFDGSGHVDKAVMTKSTGSKLLDKNTLDFARKNWTGKPNTTINAPVIYQPFPLPANFDPAKVIHTPLPPYPLQSRQMREHGRGIVKVTFDELGHPVRAVMTQSTYSDRLDSNTVNYALKAWHAPPGKSNTIEVPVVYELR